MTAASSSPALRILDENPLKLGLFGMTVSGGITMTDVDGAFELSWESTLSLARQADAMGLDLLVPVARWRGYDGRLDPNGQSYETFTWAAGVAASTSRIVVTATAHAPALHPLVAAKQAATVDAISGGRFALNAVMGWFSPELDMFGIDTKDHDDRYRFGDEWMTVIDRLWAESEPFDHDGRAFQMKGAKSAPRPATRPLVLNAGASPAGIDFSARHADVNFATIMTVEQGRQLAESIHKVAEGHGRQVRVMTYGTVVIGDTEADAHRRYQEILDHGDVEAARNFMHFLGLNSSSFEAQIVAALEEHFVSSGGGFPIVGTAEQVADQLAAIHDTGIEGFMMGGVPYSGMLNRFDAEVMPLLKERGLRV
ncbi:LLM class flavin-dependent oxidoreductase (plasmid) [Pseudonocardia bannensis]|uniref:LLM class flavin-dependent oxidoreductase n=1 Tax=Pseudonocardia bannensis TaxID=630973 RepID=A0A848DIT9_9PSEU|nr:LLM class flavin-dependent oxidoreductase [Pseudonocardia bannensis]NMH92463.1 LLM class flavin-dependent oxidoreductase [Pseudonocardia bannensis]